MKKLGSRLVETDEFHHRQGRTWFIIWSPEEHFLTGEVYLCRNQKYQIIFRAVVQCSPELWHNTSIKWGGSKINFEACAKTYSKAGIVI